MNQEFNLLVVEDTPIAQTMARIILTGLGCQVQIAKDGAQALSMFQAQPYDLIFMDLGLPDISGIDVTKAMRNLEQNTLPTPIIALTANYDPASKALLLGAGMNDCLPKPLTKEDASAILNKFC